MYGRFIPVGLNWKTQSWPSRRPLSSAGVPWGLWQSMPSSFLNSSQPVDDYVAEIVATQMGITIGRFHLEYPVARLKDGNIERSPPGQIRQSWVCALLIEAIGQCSSRGLVDDPANFKPAISPASLMA